MVRSGDLKGLPVTVTVSDPWEFVTQHGSGPFAAAVVAVGRDTQDPERISLLLKLQTPISHADTSCEYLVALERAANDHFEHLHRGGTVDCALTQVPQERALAADPFDLGWWRGGIALLGSMRRIATRVRQASDKQ